MTLQQGGDYRLFERVATNLSFAAAARDLRLSPAIVTRRIAAFEARLGVRLFTRTSRSCRLTDDGQRFLVNCREILSRMDEAEEEMRSRRAGPTGLLRVAAPISFGRRYIAPIVTKFAIAYPDVSVRLYLSDSSDELTAREHDLVIRIGLPERGANVVRRVLAARRAVCATPGFLDAYGTPRTPLDLARCRCLVLQRDDQSIDNWMFEVDGRMETVRVNAVLTSNSGEVIQQWLLAGQGIALKSVWDVAADLDEGRLLELFPGLCSERADIFVLYPKRENLPARVRLFIDVLAERLQREQRADELERVRPRPGSAA